MTVQNEPGPDSPSLDHLAMQPYWAQIQTMLDGAEAMRSAGEKYLPRFPKETLKNYKNRLKTAVFTNVFKDIVDNLASKPFAKPLVVKEGTVGAELKTLCDDVDGGGNNLHCFAGETFFNGIAKAIDYIFVDYTKVPAGASLAEEKKLGARPYWVHISAERVLYAETAMVGGKEEYVHVRISECVTVREGYTEKLNERVRVYDRVKVLGAGGTANYMPATWELLEKQTDPNTRAVRWVSLEKGSLRVEIIPLVPFFVGRRKGSSWVMNPPMRDAADTQIVLYQRETNLRHAEDLTGAPILTGCGIAPPAADKNGNRPEIPLGPSAVLFAPMGADGKFGEWKFISPAAEGLKFLASQVEATERKLRELGRNPLTAQSGNLTVVTTAFAAQKGNSAVQAWALRLKDALEQALRYTALWLNDTTSKPEVNVYTDFGIETGDGTSMDRVIKMRAAGDLSREQLWDEAKRRGELSADMDNAKEKQRLADEGPDPLSEADIAGSIPPRQPPRLAA